MEKDKSLQSRRDIYMFQLRKNHRRSIIDQRRKQNFGQHSIIYPIATCLKHLRISEQGMKIIQMDKQLQLWMRKRQSQIQNHDQVAIQNYKNDLYNYIAQKYNIIKLFQLAADFLLMPMDNIRSKETLKAHQDFWRHVIFFFENEKTKPYIQKGINLLMLDMSQQVLINLEQQKYIDFFQQLQTMFDFFFEFIHKNKNRDLCKNSKLNKYILRVMQLLTQFFDDVSSQKVGILIQKSNEIRVNICFEIGALKWKIVNWLQCIDNMSLVRNCVSYQFISPGQAKNLYEMINLGLKSNKRQLQMTTASVLYQLLLKADWDDIVLVYQKYHSLMITLIGQTTKILQHCFSLAQSRYSRMKEQMNNEGGANIFLKKQGLRQSTYKFKTDQHIQTVQQLYVAVVLLLDSYDQVIRNYMRTGVAYLATYMVALACTKQFNHYYQESTSNQIVVRGLDVLRILTSIEKEDSEDSLFSQTVLKFLMQNQDIRKTHFWDIFSGNGASYGYFGPHFFFHPNHQIKRFSFSIVSNLLQGGQKRDINVLLQVMHCNNFLPQSQKQFKQQLGNNMYGNVISVSQYLKNEKKSSSSRQTWTMDLQEIPIHLVQKINKFDFFDILSQTLKNHQKQPYTIMSDVLKAMKVLLYYKFVCMQSINQGAGNTTQTINQFAYRMEVQGLLPIIQHIKGDQNLEFQAKQLLQMYQRQKRAQN